MTDQISKNFNLQEFLVSQTAVRYGIDMTPPPDIKDNIIELVTNTLQPIRDEAGPLTITSGYRPEELNSLIGGSKTSAHRFGCAADVRCNAMSALDLCELAISLGVPFDQVIHEFGVWMHIGIRWDTEPYRKQTLTAYKIKGRNKTMYTTGLHAMKDLV